MVYASAYQLGDTRGGLRWPVFTCVTCGCLLTSLCFHCSENNFTYFLAPFNFSFELGNNIRLALRVCLLGTDSGLYVHPEQITYRMISKYSYQMVFATDLRSNAEYHREQTLCHSTRTSKVLQMQPSTEARDIIWRSYMSVKVATCVNIWKAYGTAV